MQTWISGIIGFSIPLFLGWQLVVFLERKTKSYIPVILKLSLSFGLGFGLISWFMFITSLILGQWCLLILSAIIIVLSLLLWFIHHKQRESQGGKLNRDLFPETKDNIKIYSIKWILIILIVIQILYVFSETIITPLYAWDSWAIWALKGRIFFSEKSIPFSYFQLNAREFGHPDYPLLIPLSETWIGLWLNQWNESIIKILFPLFFVALLTTFYYSIRSQGQNIPYLALGFTAFLATIPQVVLHGTLGLADLPLAYYGFSSFIFLLWWMQMRNPIWLLFSSLYGALGMWTKNEGMPLFLISFMLVLYITIKRNISPNISIKSKIVSLFIFGVVPAVIILPWLLYKYSFHIQNDIVTWNRILQPETFIHISRIPKIISYFLEEMINLNRWNILWIGGMVVYLLNGFFRYSTNGNKTNLQNKQLTIIYILIYALVILAVYTFRPTNINYVPQYAFKERILLHILPQFLFLSYLLVHLSYKHESSSNKPKKMD